MAKTVEQVEVEQVPEPKAARQWNVGGIFWGLLLVLVGVILLLDNLGVIKADFSNVWQLWPVVIIGAGLSLLSLRGWVGAVVSFVVAVLLLGLVAFAVVDNPLRSNTRSSSEVQTTALSDSADGAKSLDVEVNVGAASIEFGSSDSRQGVEAVQRSNRPSLEHSAKTEGDTREIEFRTKQWGFSWFGSLRNDIAIDLTRSLPVALTIDSGAVSVSGDLSQVRLSSLNIDTGASSVDLRLGQKEPRQTVVIDAGASDVTLHIPKSSAIRVEMNGGLTSTEIEGADKLSDSLYQTADFDRAESQITLRVDMGASSFQIKRY